MANIYIDLEIKARELEGRLLLGLIAAERGHDVLLGKVSSLAKKDKIEPGIFHAKSLTPGKIKLDLHGKMNKAGFAVTSQDEEHGLLRPDYDAFATARFSEESLNQAKYVFCWGNHDASSLKRLFPGHDNTFVTTGSPRVDFWRPVFDEYFENLPLPIPMDRKYKSEGYVLVASNLGGFLADRKPWDTIRAKRGVYFSGDDDPVEFNLYEAVAYRWRLTGHFVRAIRHLAKTFPNVLFIMRPHPIESEQVWENLLGTYPNVKVRKDGSISKWIRASKLLIQNGCTSAFEAAFTKVPIVSWRPVKDVRYDLEVPNKFGIEVTDVVDLVEIVRRGLKDPQSIKVEDRTHLLNNLFSGADGKLSADQIVDEWDKAHIEDGRGQVWRNGRSVARVQHYGGVIAAKAKQLTRRSEERAVQKFPPLTRREVVDCKKRISESLGRFEDVSIKILGPKICAVRQVR